MRKYFVNISGKKGKLFIIIIYAKIIRILCHFRDVQAIRYIADSGKEIQKYRVSGS